MDLIVEPDTYTPSISADGSYIDAVPSSAHFMNGMRCNCGGPAEKRYDSRASFSIHVKTIRHQRWLQNLNANRANHHVELEEARRLIEQQKLIIARMERDLAGRDREIQGLTVAIQSLSRQNGAAAAAAPPPQIDLLDF
jgi:hypothetical protein